MPKESSSPKPLRALIVLLGGGLLVLLIARTGSGRVLEQARAVGWGMVLILALGGVSHLLRTCAWRLAFRSDIRQISFAKVFALRLISEAIGNFGLAGQVAGDTVRVSLLGPTIPIADRISSVTLDRGIYTLTAAVVSVVGVLASVLLLPLPGMWRTYALLFAASLSVVVLLTLLSFTRGWRFLSGATRALRHVPGVRERIAHKVPVVEAVEQNLLTFHSQAPREFWVATTLYLMSQALAIAEVYLLLMFMGSGITFTGAVVIEAFTKLISVVGAVNPGNIGTYEGGNLVLARMLRIAPAAGLMLALCRRGRTLFWAGIGALCLVVLSRGKEPGVRKSTKDPKLSKTPAPAAAGNSAVHKPSNSPTVIVVVDSKEGTGGFRPALATVGSLPVSLRAILTVEKMEPSRVIISIPSNAAAIVKGALLRTGRLPQGIEWHERGSGTDLCSLVSDVAETSDRVVLVSGSTIYSPTLVSAACNALPTREALVFKSGTRPAGLAVLSKTAALHFLSVSKVDGADDLQSWIEAKYAVDVADAPTEQWQPITTAADCVLSEQKLDNWLFKPTDGIFARFNRRISIPISRQLIKTPITPNIVTFVILGVSIAGALFFARGGYWNILAGALLSVWASILDGCDGEVARFKLLSSKLGAWLDTICDYLYYLMTFVGITLGLNRSSGGSTYLMWGVALIVGAFLSFFVVSFMRRRVAADDPSKFLARFQHQAERRSSNPLVFVARNCEFIIRRCFFPYALLVAALLNILKPIFVMTAVGANLVWIIALYSSFALRKKMPGPGLVPVALQPNGGD